MSDTKAGLREQRLTSNKVLIIGGDGGWHDDLRKPIEKTECVPSANDFVVSTKFTTLWESFFVEVHQMDLVAGGNTFWWVGGVPVYGEGR